MGRIYKSMTDLIGNTPLLELNRMNPNGRARVIVKIESFNPGGSVKDRAALSMIDDAEKSGTLTLDSVIIEPTSGNMGVGLAWVGKMRGYRVILTMPDSMSLERRNLLKALGAEIVLTPGADGMMGAVKKAEELRDSMEGAVILRQFENPANPLAHQSTAFEIWNDTDGAVDVFVAGVGTGGTLSGTGKVLKSLKKDIKVIGVEPMSSPILSGGQAGPHMIQGIGANFIPKNYDASIVDRVETVSNEDAIGTARRLAQEEGVLCGISSGASVAVALRLAQQEEFAGKTIVAILPDTGERYLSTKLFDFEGFPVD